MNIDIWSDIACPFCFIGMKQLEAALEQFTHRDETVVTFHSFQLDPNAEVESTLNIYEMLAKKYGRSEEVMRESNERSFANASEFGIDFNFDDVKLTNSFDAHRLIHFALSKGRQSEMKSRLMKAYFTDGLNVGKQETLIKLASELGLDANEVSKMLDSDNFSKEVQGDIAQAKELGITGVPMFVVNMEFAVSGAQGTQALLAMLNEAWENS